MDEKLNQNNLNHKRIAVIGIGGVGGYMAGMLGKAYRHVTLAARGERLRSLREKGRVLHSDLHGEMTVFPERVVPVEEIGAQDYIFVCVKNFTLLPFSFCAADVPFCHTSYQYIIYLIKMKQILCYFRHT